MSVKVGFGAEPPRNLESRKELNSWDSIREVTQMEQIGEPSCVSSLLSADLASTLVKQNSGALYVGQTRDLGERVRKHRYGLGSKFTADHASPRLVFCEGPMSPEAAVGREAQLKRWSRPKKEALIRGDVGALTALSRSRS